MIKLLFYIVSICMLSPSALSSASTEYQGGLREYFITSNQYGFESDHAAQTKHEILEAGFQSIVLHLRLGVRSSTDHYVFHPAIKSPRTDLEIMLSRILQANAGIVLKPGLYENPGLGTPSSIPRLHSDDPQSLFTYYGQTLQLYFAIASKREIETFVLGMGMGQTFTSEFAPRWKALVMNARRMLDPKTTLALELSHSDDVAQLEKWAQTDPSSLYEIMDSIGQIRFTIPLNQYVDSSTLALNTVEMKNLIQNRYQRLRKLFRAQTIVLSNVSLPGCYGFTSNESEVDCPNILVGDINAALSAQTSLVRGFISEFKDINSKIGSTISALEIIMANTDNEPTLYQANRRFPYFNREAYQAIKTSLTVPPSAETSTVSTFFKSKKAAFLPKSATDPVNQKTACIYFDEKDEHDRIGPIHARLLENLIGAFKDWRRERRSITLFEAGDLQNCNTVFYLGSNISVDAPPAFYPELAKFMQGNSVVWFNYKMDRFLKTFAELKLPSPLAFDIPMIMQPDSLPTKANVDPGFYRYFDYKGETFYKQAMFDGNTGLFAASPELNQVRILDPKLVEVRATARHSKSGAITPYVVTQKTTNGRVWYFADLPFSFIHYEDRYLILCDQLWDILNEEAPTTPPQALVRIEDVNSSDDLSALTWVSDYLSNENVPFSLAVIPYYSSLFYDPFSGNPHSSTWEAANLDPPFTGFLNYAKALGANFVFHGVAHQSGDLISGYHGVSAADYEFWLYPKNTPLPQDSASYVTQKIEKGEDVFEKLGIRPIAWEVPHYASSVLDSYIFGKTFEWNYHRSLYFKSEVLQDALLTEDERFFNCVTAKCRSDRDQKLAKIKVVTDYTEFGTQVLPFRIWKDSYGQALIPETLGMIDFALYPKDTWRPVSYPEDVLRRAKKLKVIRGAIASFFWHPELMGQKAIYYQTNPGSYAAIGGRKTMITVIEGLKALGYQFISTGDCNIFPHRGCENKE